MAGSPAGLQTKASFSPITEVHEGFNRGMHWAWQWLVLAGCGLLLARMVLLALDPRSVVLLGENLSEPLYNTWLFTEPVATGVDMVYLASNLLLWPLLFILRTWQTISTTSLSQHFYWPVAEVFQHWGVAIQSHRLPGVVDGVAALSLLSWLLLGVVVPWVTRRLKATYWQWWTEWQYHQARQHQAEEALAERQQALLALSQDLSAMQASAASLHRQNVTDHLTGLYNKRFFTEKLADTFAQARSQAQSNGTSLSAGSTNVPCPPGMGLMMMDIDHFKKLNDTYGHAMGDGVLADVAQVIQQQTPNGAYACRYGGEEFGIIFTRHTPAQMQLVSNHIRAGVCALRWPEHAALTTSVSQGLAVYLSPEGKTMFETESALLKAADAALYQAKRNGRNQLCEYSSETMPA